MKEDKVLKKNPDVVTRQIDKETILVPIFRNSKDADYIYTLNPVASLVWDLVDGKRTLKQIKELILRKFDATPKEADREMAKFLKDLKVAKAIV